MQLPLSLCPFNGPILCRYYISHFLYKLLPVARSPSSTAAQQSRVKRRWKWRGMATMQPPVCVCVCEIVRESHVRRVQQMWRQRHWQRARRVLACNGSMQKTTEQTKKKLENNTWKAIAVERQLEMLNPADRIKENYFVLCCSAENDTEDGETHTRNEATLALAFFKSQKDTHTHARTHAPMCMCTFASAHRTATSYNQRKEQFFSLPFRLFLFFFFLLVSFFFFFILLFSVCGGLFVPQPQRLNQNGINQWKEQKFYWLYSS